jgi:drug/metabolite transporter (DMT)-like permease
MENQANQNIAPRHWITLFFLSLIWGTSFILIKRALVVLNPIQIASLRIAITFIAFIPLLIIHFKKFDLKDWYKYLLVGLTTTGIPSFCFAFAQKYIDSGTTGILNSLTPIFTFIVSVIVFKAKFEYSKLLGVVIGFLGAGILVYGTSGINGSSSNSIIGFIIVLIATINYGFNANLIKYYFPTTKPILVSVGAFTTVGVPVLIHFLFTQDVIGLLSNSDNYTGLGAVTILSLVCTLLANLYFYKLVQNTNPVFASTVTFIIPAVACFWAIIDGEQVNFYHLIAIICIVVALLILRKK